MKLINMLNVRYPWLVIATFVGFTLFFSLQLPKTEIDPEVKSMLPTTFKSRINLNKIEEIFGGNDMAMIILQTDDVLNTDTLKKVKKISRQINRIEGVDKVLSLFELKEIRGQEDAMIVNPAVYKIPRNREQTEELRRRLRDNDMVYGSVVSHDFSATAIIATLKINVDDSILISKFQKIVDKNQGPEKLDLGGLPYIRMRVAQDIRTDFRKFMPFGLVIMLIFLFICFRQFRGVLLPFSVVIMSIIFTMGMIPIIGWKIQMVTVILPVILLAVTNDYGIHLISKYQEDNFVGNKFKAIDLAQNVVNSLGKPIIITGITTMAGMLCLLSHIITPAKQLGVLAGIGILYALVASLTFIPSMLILLPRAKSIIDYDNGKRAMIERLLDFTANSVAKHPKQIIITFLLITLLSSFGIQYIVVDTNPENYYPKGSEVVKASNIINEKFGGSTSISIIATGDIKEPANLKLIDQMEKELQEMPDIGHTSSIARVVRQMSKALNNEDEPGYDKIPIKRNTVAQYFELYNMSGDPDDFEKLVDFPYENAQIIARINQISSTKIKNVVTRLEKHVKDTPLFSRVAGFGAIFAEVIDGIVKGQILSLTLSLIIVSFFVMILFRSFIAGLFGAIPIGLSLVFLFGLMGYLDIELNAPTALLSSIMIGVGIDYTIHFLWRYKVEYALNFDPVKAVKQTLITSGRGITFNALSVVIGFVVLLLSNFLPVRFFGFLIVISISSCLLAALVLLPSLCIIFKPRFLEPNK